MKHRYQNGNYIVEIDDDDGTKTRDSGDEPEFLADFPESIDLNITDWCNIGCPFCYRNCTTDGKHASYEDVAAIIDTMLPWTEVALGGGSPIMHPDLDKILDLCSDNDLLANMTVHWRHFIRQFEYLKDLADAKKLFGIGCSVDHFSKQVAESASELKNSVVHLIAGIIKPKELLEYASSGAKILLLGYKNLGRAKTDAIPDMKETRRVVELIVHGHTPCKVLSFDNLALDQLGVKEILQEDAWKEVYMGDDGVDGKLTSASMYVDAVAHTFSRNSLTSVLHSYNPAYTPKVEWMYKQLVDHE